MPTRNAILYDDMTIHTTAPNLPLHPAPSHYDAEYFRWQSRIGRFGGWANLSKFTPYLSPKMKVIDFGCGGGYLLSNINCREKLGVEINPVARAEASLHGIPVVATAEDAEDDWADLIISNHALEHCASPLGELRALKAKMLPGARMVCYVPCESIRHRFNPRDSNHHLYSWSPMSAANLFTEAGYAVEESTPYVHVWPPRFIPRMLKKLGGRFCFEMGCRLYGRLSLMNLTPCTVLQVRVVAKRPAHPAEREN